MRSASRRASVRRGSQSFEDGSGRAELELARLVVPERAARESHQHPHACGLVRRLDLLPQLESATQRTERGLSVAFGQVDRASRLRSHRSQHVRVERRRDLLQLAAGAARFVDVADGQHDLDVRGQQLRALQRVGGRAHDAADRRGRRVGASLGQPQQGESRLRFPSQAARGAIRLLGGRKLPAQAVQLRLLVERRGRRRPVEPLGETLAGAACLRHRVRPGAAAAA